MRHSFTGAVIIHHDPKAMAVFDAETFTELRQLLGHLIGSGSSFPRPKGPKIR